LSGGKSVHVFYRLFIYALLLGIQLLREVDCDPIHRFFFIFFYFLLCLTSLSAIFQLFYGDQFTGGGSRSTRREQPTIGKQLVNFITCGCESSAPFL
jgi:hypothetical protein